jgi:hypothetical protein
MFIKYPHLERLGSEEVEGILCGEVYVFPKIDGTNASVWLEDGALFAGSRKRQLSLLQDNQGFYAYVLEHVGVGELLSSFPDWRLYGEWLVPHTLKTYRKDAWRKFYVFDVFDSYSDAFLQWEDYEQHLRDYNVDCVPVQAIVSNPTQEWLIGQLEANTYLIEDGKGPGEGIVLKRYGFENVYGRVTWAKIVRNEFKESHKTEMGVNTVEMFNLEHTIVEEFLTEHVVQKVKAEIVPWSSKRIPELFGRVWHEFIVEESFAFIKKHKNPVVHYDALYRYVIQRVKELLPETF